jgi:hypothetical protein
MRAFLIIFTLIIALPVLVAQTVHHFSTVIGVDYLYRSDDLGPRHYAESPSLHLRIGGDYSRELTSFLHLRTGARLTGLGYDSGIQQLIGEVSRPHQLDGGASAFMDPTTSAGWYFQTTDFYLEIPLVFRYQPKSSGHFYVEGGLAAYFCLKSYSRSNGHYGEKTYWDVSRSADKLISVLQASAGWEWRISKEGKFYVQPIFRYFLTDNPSFKMLSGGLETGVRW